MVDFSKLRIGTPEEREAQREASLQALYARDDLERDLASKRAVTMTLVEEPHSRARPDGTEVIIFRGVEKGSRNATPMIALYEVPERTRNTVEESEKLDRSMRSLGGGDKLSVAGGWAKRGWDGPEGRVERWEFKARHFAVGEVPLEAMLARNRGVEAKGVETSAGLAQESVRTKEPGRVAEAARAFAGQMGR